MSRLPRLLAPAAALAQMLVPLAAAAAPVAATKNDVGRATILKSLSIVKKSDLEFGELVVTGTGTAVIDPAAGTLSTTGAVIQAGTAAHPAIFTATGSKNSVVLINLPNKAATLNRVGGGGSMTVSDWTVDGKIIRKFPLNSTFDFAVGGTLNVGAGQPEGDYVGTFDVTVQYP